MDDTRIKNFTSCFKDEAFLEFFFSRLKANTFRYETEFPYISPCGRELNYIRCDDLPVVFTRIDHLTQELIWANTNKLRIHFDPENIYMSNSGRIYYPFPKYPFVGLIASKVGIEISNNFIFNGSTPTNFTWQGKQYKLTNLCESLLQEYHENSQLK